MASASLDLHLLSFSAAPLFDEYQVILFGDRGTQV